MKVMQIKNRLSSFLQSHTPRIYGFLRKYGLVSMRPDGPLKDGLVSLVNSLGKDHLVVVEIGSYRGESASLFLKTGKVDRIYCVDPWKTKYDDADCASESNMALVEKIFDLKHGKDKRVVKVVGTIETFLSGYNVENVDLVYIDGCHTYEAVKNDIQKTLSGIKPKLAIAGHDYIWKDVETAVKETLGEPDKTFCDTSWIKFVKETSE